jgi:hypothetical protein
VAAGCHAVTVRENNDALFDIQPNAERMEPRDSGGIGGERAADTGGTVHWLG